MLEGTGDFRQVTPEVEETEGGVEVTFVLEPREILTRVLVEGNFLLLKRDVEEVVLSAERTPLDGARLEKDLQRIQALYRRHGFFDTTVTMERRTNPETGDTVVVFTIDEGRPGVVQEVRIQGSSLPADELQALIPVYPLAFFNLDDLEESVEVLRRHLRRRGFIRAKVSARATLQEGGALPTLSLSQPLKSVTRFLPGSYQGVAVVFEVEEGERFDILLEGVASFPPETIAGLVTFYEQGFFDQSEAEESRTAIQRFYRQKGHYHVRVDVSFSEAQRRAVFTVAEGAVARITDVRFQGNTAISTRQLRRLVQSGYSLWGSTPYQQEAVDADRALLRSRHLARGFVGVRVEARMTEFDATGERGTLLFTIHEGDQTTFRGVFFQGNAAFSQEDLLLVTGAPPAEGYDPDWVEGAVARLVDHYRRQGYDRCRVEARQRVGDQRQVDVTFHLQEGRAHRIGGILVAGNARTRGDLILRALGLRPGEILDATRVEAGRQRLFGVGMISSLDLVRTGSGEEPVTDLVVRIQERVTSRTSLGLGYSSDERFRAYVELAEENLFGTARGVRAKYRLSGAGNRYDLFFREPFLGSRRDLNLNLYREVREEPGYTLVRRGADLFTDFQLGPSTHLYTAYRNQSLTYRDLRGDLEETMPEEAYRIGSLLGRLFLDRRDNPVNPHRGVFASAGVEAALGPLGSEVPYLKFEGSAGLVVPVTTRQELVLSLRGDLARLLEGGNLPISERYFAGGANSVRGCAEKALGPVSPDGTPLGGNFRLLANVEWRFTGSGGLGGVAFLDAGNVWGEPGDFRPREIRVSVGTGLHYGTPVGPARLEYGYQLNPEGGEAERWRIHFTLGYPF
jgi:outer membrane protein insertion porin family